MLRILLALSINLILSAPVLSDEIDKIVGLWQGEAFCGAGYDVRFEMSVYPEEDPKGNNAIVRIGASVGARINQTNVAGRIFYNGGSRANITFTPAADAPKVNKREDAPEMIGRKTRSGLAMRPQGGLRCGDVKFELVSADPEPSKIENPIAEVPTELAPFLGNWDGAVVDDRGDFVRVSFSIVPATGGRSDDIFDATVDYGGEIGIVRLTLGEQSGYQHFEIAPKTGTKDQPSLRLSGTFRANLEQVDGRDYFEFFMYGAEKGDGFAARRPSNRGEEALRLNCQKYVDPLISSLSSVRNLSRDLRIAFYPALADYVGKQSSLDGAATIPGMTGQDLALLVHDCIATGTNAEYIAHVGIFDDVIDSQAIVNARFSLKRVGSIEDLITTHKKLEETTGELSLEAIVAELGDPLNQVTVAALLSHVERVAQRPGFSSIAPNVLVTALAPFQERLDVLEEQASYLASEKRRQEAARRTAGMVMPTVVPADRVDAIQGLADGTKSFFSRDDMAYFGGMVAGALERCDLPKEVDQRFMLTRLFVQGIDQATFGNTYATGSIEDALVGTFVGSFAYASGAELPEDMGCQSAYLAALLQNLAEVSSDRKGLSTGRASLYVRSCALDRTEEQCNCMAGEISSVIPGIDNLEYDRMQLESVVQGNPLVAGRLVTICQVSDY